MIINLMRPGGASVLMHRIGWLGRFAGRSAGIKLELLCGFTADVDIIFLSMIINGVYGMEMWITDFTAFGGI